MVAIDQLFNDRGSRVANCGDHGVRLNDVPVIENNSLSGNRVYPRVQPNFNPPVPKLELAIFPKLLPDLRQQKSTAMNQHQTEFFRVDARIESLHVSKQIPDLPGRLDSGIAATHNHKS